MAQGSSNIRGRSSDASKPYDVSNSFVKRVASRVTELLPQPSSWFSRWMSPSDVPNASDFVGHSLSSTITSRPPATTRAELNLVDNVDHHAPVAKKLRTNRYNSPVNQTFLRSDQYGAEDISPIAVRGGGEPVAGPSTRDTQPELIASTPAVPGQQTVAKVNGDDCSETSESTSGCSSLVPQAQSSSRSLGGGRYGRFVPEGSTLDALDRRRPSFNTTTFNSHTRASMRARLGSSPFYSGRTMYGGSSQSSEYTRLVETSQSRRASLVRRVGPTVRPPPPQQSSLPLSSTAKRILDALEQFSTPMIDAKKMPVVGTKRKLDSTLSGAPQRYVELNIPSTPDLLRVKRRERLQQSTLDARQMAAQSTPRPAPPTPAAAEYTIRNDDTDRKKHTGKVKTKEKLKEEETVMELKLPAAVLAVDNLPKIDIAIPPPPPVLEVSSQPEPGSKFVFSQPVIVTSVVPVSVPTPTLNFKFSEPLADNTSSSSVSVLENNKHVVSSVSQKSRTSTDAVPSNFTKQNESEKKYNSFIVDKTVSTQKWECTNCKNNNSSGVDVCISCQTSKSSKTLDDSRNNIKPSTSSGFANLYKKPVGSWECSTCLILNKGEATKCVACESSKPAPKEKTAKKDGISDEKLTVQPPSDTKTVSSGFGNLYKKPPGWICDVCMINNDADKIKCAACETPKPVATIPKAKETSGPNPSETKPLSSGFGNLYKKPPGWTCDVCMINNDADKIKCAACETPKPGATIPKAKETSGLKFSFGIPAAISNSSTKVEATFSFGIPKEDQASSTLNTSLSVPKQSITSIESAQAPTFSFGIPKSENNNMNAVMSSTSSSKPTFQFGSSSVQANAQDTKPSTAGTPSASNIFSNLSKNSIPEKKKQAETEKPEFSVPSLTPSTSASIKSATSVFGVKSEKSSAEVSKTNNTPTLFAFGTSEVVQKKVKTLSDASSVSKSTQSAFKFGVKQEEFGSSLPSSTTNTLSSSSPSNVFKFGDTKTVSSGSGSTIISTVSTQASVMTPKPNNMFSFGSKTEKKPITFGETPLKEATKSLSTPTTENKQTFGSFGTPNTTSTFGSTNTFGSSSLANKEQQPTPFVTQTTTNTFGTTTANTSSSTFPSFGQTNAFQAQVENKPSPVFNFGVSAPQKDSAPSGGFVFKPTGFTSVQNQPNTSSQQLFGFSNASGTASAPSPAFNFEPKPFGSSTPGVSPFSAPGSAQTPVFGPAAVQQVPSFGEQATSAPVFNFGSQSAQPTQTPANPMFEFGSIQQGVAATPQPAPTFMFGAASSAPAAAPTNPPAFDPNIKPTFNFTQGAAAPVFSAIPTVNSTGPAQPQNRKIRKAVRRTNISSVRN